MIIYRIETNIHVRKPELLRFHFPQFFFLFLKKSMRKTSNLLYTDRIKRSPKNVFKDKLHANLRDLYNFLQVVMRVFNENVRNHNEGAISIVTHNRNDISVVSTLLWNNYKENNTN